MQTRLSLWTGIYFGRCFEDAIDSLLRDGIYAAELSNEHGKELFERGRDVLATGRAVSEFLAQRGFEMSQGHLPLRFKIVEEREKLPLLLEYIDLYAACGVKNMVLHCDRMYHRPEASTEERIGENVESLKTIARHVRGRGIHICLENLRQSPDYPFAEILPLGHAQDLLHIIDRVGSEDFGICLDTGHLNLVGGNQGEFIRTAKERLYALHIDDNRGTADDHLMPFTHGTVDFFEVMRALCEVDYHGLFNLEIPGENKIPFELRGEKIKYIKACYEYLLRTAQAGN